MEDIARIINRDFTEAALKEIEQNLNDKNLLSHNDIKMILVASSPANFNPFNFVSDEHIFFVLETLILNNQEPDVYDKIFKDYCDIKLKLATALENNKQKLLGFVVDLKIPKEIEAELRDKCKNFRDSKRYDIKITEYDFD